MTDSSQFAGGHVTRILIVDDHPLIREGLTVRISSQSDLQVCGEAASVEGALAQMKSAEPDLVIIDMQLAESHGLDLIKEIDARFPGTKMLVVSAFDESLYAERCLRAGAHGYINKREVQESVLDAVRTVLGGNRYLRSKMTQRVVAQAIAGKGTTSVEPVSRLTNRELEVFRLIGQGQTTGAIARQLGLSVHTIETHREKIRHKLGVRNGSELMQRAVQWVLENG